MPTQAITGLTYSWTIPCGTTPAADTWSHNTCYHLTGTRKGRYSTGWSSIPLGSRINSFSATISCCTNLSTGSTNPATATATILWPESSVIGSGVIPLSSCNNDSGSSVPSSTYIYEADQSSTYVVQGEIYVNESFYAENNTVNFSSLSVDFDPPPSKTLFFGATC